MTSDAPTPAPAQVVPAEPAAVLSSWFGTQNADGRAADATAARWFKKDPAFDQTLRERFGALHEAIVNGQREAWLETPQGALAYIIVLDQFSRNMFRDGPGMFAADDQALAVAKAAIDQGWDRQLALAERTFLYMPLMHSEQLADQDRCVELFASLRDELDGAARERVGQNHHYAVMHRDIVAQWGRFPHRNALLGRESTPEEIAFLKQPGSSF